MIYVRGWPALPAVWDLCLLPVAGVDVEAAAEAEAQRDGGHDQGGYRHHQALHMRDYS